MILEATKAQILARATKFGLRKGKKLSSSSDSFLAPALGRLKSAEQQHKFTQRAKSLARTRGKLKRAALRVPGNAATVLQAHPSPAAQSAGAMINAARTATPRLMGRLGRIRILNL